MNHILTAISVFAVFAAAILQSCGKTDTPSPLEAAESALETGNYRQAQALCDNLAESESFDALSVSQLCRLSLIFARLAEETHGNEDANTASAARSLDAAFVIDPDSVHIFLSQASAEDRGRLALINAITESHRNPTRPDSTLFYEYENEQQ